MVDAITLHVVWFETSVNSDVYLENVLKNSVWQTVKAVAIRRQYWFHQDGAICHTCDCAVSSVTEFKVC